MPTWRDYCTDYSVNETDLAAARRWSVYEPGVPVHLFAIDPVRIGSLPLRGVESKTPLIPAIASDYANTERELSVSDECPDRYRSLAAQLAKSLSDDEWRTAELAVHHDVPSVAQTLVETSSGHPVALRCEFESSGTRRGVPCVVLALPEGVDLVPWYRAFLEDVHEIDPESVPKPPTRLAIPEDWYAPRERDLALRIIAIDDQIERLQDDRRTLEADLAAEGEKTDAGPRRAVWGNGEQLEAAIHDILCDFGFSVQQMDAGVPEGGPRREDFRLTHSELEGWEALVEVKGYSEGTRTNDVQQVNRHQMRYATETGREPGLTMWVTNTHRRVDPSDRPRPDSNVDASAKMIGAVHVLATDLYRLWVLVVSGRLDALQVVHEMRSTEPGCWKPSALD